ncbi:MAG: sensor histidine kinase, partial [bacterium]
MNRTPKKMALLVGLMSLALAGLVALQLILLDHARELKKQTFRQNVNGALNSIVQKIETHETVAMVVAITVNDSAAGNLDILKWVEQQESDSATAAKDSTRFNQKLRLITSILPDSIRKIISTRPRRVRMNMRFQDTGEDTSVDAGKITFTANATVDYPDNASQSGKSVAYRYVVRDSSTFAPNDLGEKPNDHAALTILGGRKKALISKVFDQLESTTALPLEARIEPAVLDSIVETTLRENGIEMPFVYGINRRDEKEFAFVKPEGMEALLRQSEFRTPIFPYDLFDMHDELIVYFPEQNLYMLQETGLLFVSTILLMAVIIFGFIYAVRTIFKQRRFAASLADFINNMTHEFKTPISTISLAAEAMAHSEVKDNTQRFQRYTQIIRDENSRMRQQVEKILQMSVLEKGDYELNLTEFDLHETIRNAVENIALLVEKRGGKIRYDLRAAPNKIKADAVHVANIIHNLLDNANKFTPDKPEITVSTRNNEQGIHILVSDNGIGLRAEDQKRVFEKYFRVSTGNVHDVKGFGLGLSYVRMMVEAHGGTVGLQSELKKGTTFDVFLPYSPNGSQTENSRV